MLGDDKGGGGSSLLIRREICTVPPGITFRSTIFPFFSLRFFEVFEVEVVLFPLPSVQHCTLSLLLP